MSTEEQAKDGFSVNAQKDKLTKYAEINEWNIVDYYIDEGISGKNIKDRTEVNRLINEGYDMYDAITYGLLLTEDEFNTMFGNMKQFIKE